MSRDNATRPEISAWQTGLLRLTAFPSPVSTQFSAQDWWSEVVENKPEKTTNDLKTKLETVEGSYGAGKLVLNVHPIRIEWQYAPLDDNNLEGEIRVPTIGSFSEATQDFRSLMKRWLESKTGPTLIRLAFGSVLLQQVENHRQAYKVLDSYLPFDVDADNSSDLAYQINRRRNSGVGIPGLLINRLTKWNAILLQGVISSPIMPSLSDSLPDLYVCRLELDINTAQNFDGELKREYLPNIFNELVDFGHEIVREGDIP